MSRIDRKNWTNSDIGIVNKGGMFDLIDNVVKSAYRINDDEYNHLCEVMTDDELNLFTTENPTFTEKRKMIELLIKHIDYTN